MQKDKKLWIRLSAREKEKIKKIAKENGLSMTELVLLRCSGQIVVNKFDYNRYKASIHEVSREINAIGNNINQVTHAIHICNRKDITLHHELMRFNELMVIYQESHAQLRILLKDALGF
jgi:Bacterial mobilisation protein (MobC)